MMLKNGKKVSQIMIIKQRNFQIQVSTIYWSRWLIYRLVKKDVMLIPLTKSWETKHVTQVNHEILSAKEKEL